MPEDKILHRTLGSFLYRCRLGRIAAVDVVDGVNVIRNGCGCFDGHFIGQRSDTRIIQLCSDERDDFLPRHYAASKQYVYIDLPRGGCMCVHIRDESRCAFGMIRIGERWPRRGELFRCLVDAFAIALIILRIRTALRRCRIACRLEKRNRVDNSLEFARFIPVPDYS